MSLFPCFLLMLALPDAFQPVDARHVRVGGEIGRRFEVTIHNNLLVLDAEKDFLAPFARHNQTSGYIGLGKLLLSTVRFAAYSHDARVIAFKDRLIARTIQLQEPDGYIGLMQPSARVTGMWDIHELGYIAAGLLADYEFNGNRPSLEAAQKAADYLLRNWSKLPPDWAEKNGVATHVAVTGTDRTFLAFHRLTGETRYLDFLLNQRGLATWDMPVVVGRRWGIEGHIYAYLARTLAQLELYRTRPDARLMVNADRALDFLLRNDGMSITGGAGQSEIWTDDQDGRGDLAESCATAYQLRVYDNLLRLRGDPRFGDLMERTIHNTLFGAQSPDGRRIRYYTPLEGRREYFNGDTYCCPCNFRRIIAELPELIYYQTPAAIAVNLYTQSEATIKLAATTVHLKQETAYPSEGAITLRVDPTKPTPFALKLRIPRWAKGAKVTVNGAPATAAIPGEFATIDRTWNPGDQVALNLPMRLRLVKGRQRQAGRVAVVRGPVVYTLDPTQNPALAKLDAAELSQYTLDPKTLHYAQDRCQVGLWKPGTNLAPKTDLTVTLTPFPDPQGQVTYFRLRDYKPAEPDELR